MNVSAEYVRNAANILNWMKWKPTILHHIPKVDIQLLKIVKCCAEIVTDAKALYELYRNILFPLQNADEKAVGACGKRRAFEPARFIKHIRHFEFALP